MRILMRDTVSGRPSEQRPATAESWRRAGSVAMLLSMLAGLVASFAASPASGQTISGPPMHVFNAQLQKPNLNVPASAADQFEVNDSTLSAPQVLYHQWSATELMAPENVISEAFVRSFDNTTEALTLKQAIYLAVENNPNVKASELNPVAATEAVRMANGAFDVDFVGSAGVSKTVTPSQSTLVANSHALSSKIYTWNFSLAKTLASTNGSLGISFENRRLQTNNTFVTVNPNYSTSLSVTLLQPLLRNFGMDYATLNVRVAESGQRENQWTYAQEMDDFVRQLGNDYWNVVLQHENLRVAEETLKFNQDLVRQNRISVRVGTLAPIDLQEAESAAATAEANVYSQQAALATAQAVLRQDVMFNPSHTFLPRRIEAADNPNPNEPVTVDEESSLELAMARRPELAASREVVRTNLLQVRFQANQLLPQLNVAASVGTADLAGEALCGSALGLPPSLINCVSPQQPTGGYVLPFSGGYGTALNEMFNFRYYNYVGQIIFEMPLDNAPIRAALAAARVTYEQSRMAYRDQISRVVVEVQNALANVSAGIQRVKATRAATDYAREALRDEEVRFRVGMATTHDLLQYEDSLFTAEGQQVQAEVDLEDAKLQLHQSDGTILKRFQINFQIQNPREHTPWYALF
jgi:outer membrane protein TolC